MEQIAPIRSTVIKSEAPQRHAAGLPISSDSSDCLLAPVLVPDVVRVGRRGTLTASTIAFDKLLSTANLIMNRGLENSCFQFGNYYRKFRNDICLFHIVINDEL